MSALASFARRAAVLARRSSRGFSLIEMVVFIAVTGVVLGGLVLGLTGALRSAPEPRSMHQGLQLAQARMELILAQRSNLDFPGFTSATFDPCASAPAQEACQVPNNFTVVAPCFYTGVSTCSFGASNTCQAGDANFKCVRVRVTGPKGTVVAELDAMVANY
jgi:type II secretory pathway pseudopilin PulG